MSLTHNRVLVTGATGFLGKVLLEELFRLKTELSIHEVVLLIRPSKTLSASERFAEIAKKPCFANLYKGWTDSVRVVEGDLTLPRCGLEDAVYASLCETTTHIIHTAACIKFDTSVNEALSANVDSSLHILRLAKGCRDLRQLVITSTAYVTPPQDGPIYESLVPLPRPAWSLLEDLRSGALGKSEAIELTGHRNIYSLSKCLAEHIICETKGSLPLSIVRPSIICAALEYPRPGWIDSHDAFAGIALGFANDVLKVINGRPEAKLDIVPVDKVAACLIDEAFPRKEREYETPQPRIIFSVATTTQSLTLGEACQMMEAFFKKGRFRYIGPMGGYTFDIQQFLHHYLRLQIAAAASRLSGNRAKEAAAMKAIKVLKGMNNVFGPYASNTHDFRPHQPKVRFDAKNYLQLVCEGVSQNLLHAKL
ncbi:hypothetical protein MCOR25_005864 [Pyricularia grisea]|nr:hypothetical protein MCOR25_005864 [Pyricularia grisea]